MSTVRAWVGGCFVAWGVMAIAAGLYLLGLPANKAMRSFGKGHPATLHGNETLTSREMVH